MRVTKARPKPGPHTKRLTDRRGRPWSQAPPTWTERVPLPSGRVWSSGRPAREKRVGEFSWAALACQGVSSRHEV